MSNSSVDISTVTHVHFIGIGGIGMSALARYFLHEGKTVSGSDREASLITETLEKEGVTFFVGQEAGNLTQEIDLVVYTEAMPKEQAEMVAARELRVPMMNYFDALGLVANQYYLIAVSGSHGKTTTTAMLADVFEEAGLDPTVVVGSLRAKTGSNFRPGQSQYAIVEACEYKRDFLSLNPTILVITNIEYEHVDYYRDLADVQSAFRALAEKIPEHGYVVTNTADPNIQPVIQGLACTVIDYRQFLDLKLPLKQPGFHTRLNAAAALGVAAAVSIDGKAAKSALEKFSGTWRRFQYKGEVQGVPVYDDYGHHPTELKVTMAGARELYPDRKLIVVFQSHTYTRTHELMDDFVAALQTADFVFLLPIYGAREENVSGTSSELMAELIRKAGTPVDVVQFETAGEKIRLVIKDNPQSMVLVMGAGPVTNIATELTNK